MIDNKTINIQTDWDQLIKDIDSKSIDYNVHDHSYDHGALTISNTGTSGLGNLTLDPFVWHSDSNWNKGLTVKGDIHVSPEHDIKLGEVSLKKLLEDIQHRLNILHPNPDLESQWEELRVLGDQYRALEKKILDKQTVWAALKQRRVTPENT